MPTKYPPVSASFVTNTSAKAAKMPAAWSVAATPKVWIIAIGRKKESITGMYTKAATASAAVSIGRGTRASSATVKKSVMTPATKTKGNASNSATVVPSDPVTPDSPRYATANHTTVSAASAGKGSAYPTFPSIARSS